MDILLNYYEDVNPQTFDHKIKIENQKSALAGYVKLTLIMQTFLKK